MYELLRNVKGLRRYLTWKLTNSPVTASWVLREDTEITVRDKEHYYSQQVE